MSIIARVLQRISDARAFHLGTHNPGVTLRPVDRPATDQDWADAGAVPQPSSGTASAIAALPPSPAFESIQPALEVLADQVRTHPKPGDPMSTAAVITEPTLTPATPAKKKSILDKLGDDIKGVFAFLGRSKGKALVTAGEAEIETIVPGTAGFFNLTNAWLSEVLKSQALATAAGQGTGSGAQKAAMVLAAVTPQAIDFAKANGLPTLTGDKLEAANKGLVDFANAFSA